MANLGSMKREFEENDRELVVIGIDKHATLSTHPLAARTKHLS
jgi:hypothetical protein